MRSLKSQQWPVHESVFVIRVIKYPTHEMTEKLSATSGRSNLLRFVKKKLVESFGWLYRSFYRACKNNGICRVYHEVFATEQAARCQKLTLSGQRNHVTDISSGNGIPRIHEQLVLTSILKQIQFKTITVETAQKMSTGNFHLCDQFVFRLRTNFEVNEHWRVNFPAGLS